MTDVDAREIGGHNSAVDTNDKISDGNDWSPHRDHDKEESNSTRTREDKERAREMESSVPESYIPVCENKDTLEIKMTKVFNYLLNPYVGDILPTFELFLNNNPINNTDNTFNLRYGGKNFVVNQEQITNFVSTKLKDEYKTKFWQLMNTCKDIQSNTNSTNKKDDNSGSNNALTAKAENETYQVNLKETHLKTLELKRQQTVNKTPQEIKYEASQLQGIELAYDTSTFFDEYPDNARILGAPYIKAFADDGTFIGSLPISYPFKRREELDPIKDENGCEFFKISLPSFCGLDELNRTLDVGTSSEITRRTIEEINKLAEDVDKIPTAKNIIIFLSNEYKSIPEQVKTQLRPQTDALLKAYQLVPISNKEPEYNDLSAYLNAPFPELKLKEKEDNDELNKLLEQLKDLKLEDLNVPVINPCPTEVTERQINGEGMFDHIASSIFNQLMYVRDKGLINHDEIANIYSQFLIQGIQSATQYSLEKHNITLQSYQAKIAAAQASVAVLEAKTRLLMLPSQLRLAYAQIEAQLEQLNLLRVQIELEKQKHPQVVAQTDLILAQTDGQRLNNEQAQVSIQQSKLTLVQTQEQIALMQEQNKQAQLQTLQITEQTNTIVLQNNKLVEDTKLVDAQTQHQLKQIELSEVQKVEAKARIKMLAQQLDKEKENIGLIKAQVATAFAQLSLVKDQIKASKAQYSDTIDGAPVGGLLGAQIMVNKVQASSFERKAFNEMVSQVQSGWTANKTADLAISSPVSFTPMAVDRLINWGLTKYFNMPEDTLQMPNGYTPYLTDEQMDAEESVDYRVNKGNK